jgi:chromatin assembly factor 1 subunit A
MILLIRMIRFPKITNDTIKSTLGDHFAQIGASKADKKWVFVADS